MDRGFGHAYLHDMDLVDALRLRCGRDTTRRDDPVEGLRVEPPGPLPFVDAN